MTPLMSQADFIAKVAKTNPTFEVLSEYRGVRKPVLRRCTVCGDEREVSARMLFEGRGCMVCVASARGKASRKTHEQFVSEVKAINPNIEICSEYKTNNAKIRCRCLKDEYVWETTPHILIGGSGCPLCGRAKNEIASRRRMTHEEYVSAIADKFSNIEVLSQFTSVSDRMDYRCTVCEYEWNATANTLLNTSIVGCPCCAGKAKVSEEMFIKRMMAINSNVDYVGEFVDMSHHATFQCSLCQHQWAALPSNILKGRGCPKCKESRGAKAVAQYLDNHGVTYIREHRFVDCVDLRPLPFDFYLPQLRIAIEYDGAQHFGPVTFGKCDIDVAIQKFELVQKHDKIKNEYCLNNNIVLIRIPYTDFDEINDILDKYIP